MAEQESPDEPGCGERISDEQGWGGQASGEALSGVYGSGTCSVGEESPGACSSSDVYRSGEEPSGARESGEEPSGAYGSGEESSGDPEPGDPVPARRGHVPPEPDPEALLDRLAVLRAADLPVHGGRTMAYVYDSGLDGLDELAARAAAAFAGVNGLDMTVFPSVVALENDIVGQAAALLGGDAATAGTFTSGGTESCLLAVLTAREHARRTRGVTAPEIVLPGTAHAAFHKAARLFGLTVVSVPVDPVTFRVPAAGLAAAISERTALVVVSAPSYAHGVVDPVADVAAAAAARGVLCHVDACIGGWHLGHLRLAEGVVRPPAFDLSVPGVSSLSVDLHKYAYTPKGASVLLFRDAELRRHGWFAHASWPGYPVVNATLQGTKSAGPLAAAWAVLRHLGTEGYIELSRRVHAATARLTEGLGRIDGLYVLGEPDAALVAVASDDPTARQRAPEGAATGRRDVSALVRASGGYAFSSCCWTARRASASRTPQAIRCSVRTDGDWS